jgi:hypothetical protein
MASWFLVILSSLTLASFVLAAYFFESNPVLIQSVFITFLMLLLLIIGVVSAKFNDVTNEHKDPILNFDLMLDGRVCFAIGDEYYIHQNSRIGFIGCWLALYKEDDSKHVCKSIFIFKHSVSSKSYARLCRAITRSNFKLSSETTY